MDNRLSNTKKYTDLRVLFVNKSTKRSSAGYTPDNKKIK